MIEAIANSCNYYFYSVGSGYDYGGERSLGIDMNSEKIIEAAKTFGLYEPSGIEIGEFVADEANPEAKKQFVVQSLKNYLFSVADEFFPSDIRNDRTVLESKINELIKFCLEDSEASRKEVFEFLEETFEIRNYEKLNKLTDAVKFDYMRQMGSFDGDVFNLAIGQGSNRYTPVQMARYVTTIANGGYLQKLTLIKSIDGKPTVREPFVDIDPNNYIPILQKGMYQASKTASSQSYLANFPVEIAMKTGTAQREGKLSTMDEVTYLKTYAGRITGTPFEEIEKRADEILKERSVEIGNLYNKIENEKNEAKLLDLKNELSTYSIDNYLDKGNALRIAIKEMSDRVITDDEIDRFKDNYDEFSAIVAYAPYEKPKIAVVIMVPQAGSGANSIPLLKEILGEYLGL